MHGQQNVKICGGRNLHLFRATVITSDNGVNSGSGWCLPSQYCTQTARVSGAVTVHEELQLRVFGVFIFVTLKDKINTNNVYGFHSYRAVYTLRLGYKNQSVDGVQGNNWCLL